MMEGEIPKLLINYSIPESSGTTLSFNNMIIKNMSNPTISAGFISQTGVYSKLIFPHIGLTGHFKAGIGWFSKRGAFRAVASNFTLDIILTAKRDWRNRPLFQIPICRGETKEVLLLFTGRFSDVMNTVVRPVLNSYLTENLHEILCDFITETAQFFQEKISTRTGGTGKEPQGGSFVFCGTGVKGGEGNRTQPDFDLSNFDINFEMTEEPLFTATHALIAMDGGLLYKGGSAHMDMPPLPHIHWGKKMLSFQLTEFIPNTFFHHVYTNQLGVISETLQVSDLPYVLRAPLSVVCWSCRIHMAGQLLESPMVRFTAQGISLTIKGQLNIAIDGSFSQFDLLNANLTMEVATHFVVRRSTLYAPDTELINFDVSLEEAGIGGAWGLPISDAIEFIVRHQVWPRVRRHLDNVMKHKGISLPVVCGVRFEDTDIKYLDGAVLVDTDFRYDFGPFIRIFKQQHEKIPL